MRGERCNGRAGKGFLLRFVNRREVAEAVPDVTDEVLAYLRGRSFEIYRRCGQPVPAWAYLNVLAHVEAEALRRLALLAPAGGDAPATWAEAVTTLAAELVELTSGDEALMHRVQLGPLARLEDLLMADPERPVDPSVLTSLGQAYLRQHPSTLGG